MAAFGLLAARFIGRSMMGRGAAAKGEGLLKSAKSVEQVTQPGGSSKSMDVLKSTRSETALPGGPGRGRSPIDLLRRSDSGLQRSISRVSTQSTESRVSTRSFESTRSIRTSSDTSVESNSSARSDTSKRSTSDSKPPVKEKSRARRFAREMIELQKWNNGVPGMPDWTLPISQINEGAGKAGQKVEGVVSSMIGRPLDMVGGGGSGGGSNGMMANMLAQRAFGRLNAERPKKPEKPKNPESPGSMENAQDNKAIVRRARGAIRPGTNNSHEHILHEDDSQSTHEHGSETSEVRERRNSISGSFMEEERSQSVLEGTTETQETPEMVQPVESVRSQITRRVNQQESHSLRRHELPATTEHRDREDIGGAQGHFEELLQQISQGRERHLEDTGDA